MQPHSIALCCALLFTLHSLELVSSQGASTECVTSDDCTSDRVCHENKCICSKDKPVENLDECLPQSLVGEQCLISGQCLSNSQCLDGVCSCGPEAVSQTNPSNNIVYCHPKRRLNEQCSFDSQCPLNAYCSTLKYGCRCHNGFGPSTLLQQDGQEVQECLPKTCTDSSTCESEFHVCLENKCKCIATHWDPTSARCYKFGSDRSEDDDNNLLANSNETAPNDSSVRHSSGSDDNIWKDLKIYGDSMWIVWLILILLLLIVVFVVGLLLARKYHLDGYCCWTAHKKTGEYEPNNGGQPPKNGFSNKAKNSISNKSFRRKSDIHSVEEGGACSDNILRDTADRSSLMGSRDIHDAFIDAVDSNRNQTTNQTNNNNNFSDNIQQYQRNLGQPLKTSTSTAV